MRFILVTLALLISNASLASGYITQLQLDKDVAVFASADSKAGTRPGCLAAAQQDLWTVSLQDENGKAMYSLLLTAMATNKAVEITSANACNELEGYESAQAVMLKSVAKIPQKHLKLVGYGADINYNGTECQVLATMKNAQNEDYLYAVSTNPWKGWTGCACRDSKTVRTAVAGGTGVWEFQCFIDE